MKLLMITRKVDKNDALAGFTYNWVKKIGENLDKLHVISWQKGDSGDLPENIEVIFLPENKLLKILALQKQLLKILPQVDGLFCHMNPEYTMLSAPLAKVFGKKLVVWYAHGFINWKAKLIEKLADIIVTSSPAGFRLPSPKVRILQQGIDTELFQPAALSQKNNETTEIITVGRISPTKGYEAMIQAIDLLIKQKNRKIKFSIIGEAPLKNQADYLLKLKKMVKSIGLDEIINFLGKIPNLELPRQLQAADIFINLSSTGSLDKAVLEAMASGCLILTGNEAYVKILPASLIVKKNDPEFLAEKIDWLINLSIAEQDELKRQLRAEVVTNHNLNNLAKKITEQFK